MAARCTSTHTLFSYADHRGLIPLPQGCIPRSHSHTATSTMHPDFSTQQKETVTMRFTKRSLVKTAAVSSALLGAIAVAAPASANSFGPSDYATGGYTKVSYDDANDQFCVTGTGTDYAGVTVAPSNGRRGPSYYISVGPGATKCVSLARAFEDTRYFYQAENPLTGGNYDPVQFYS